jgi:hypothetical protein
MINTYLDGAIKLARQRAKVLKGKIPNPAPIAEFAALQRICEQRIDDIINLLDYLSNDPLIRNEDAANERIRLMRRTFDDLSQLEATGIAALNRNNEDDAFMNKLVFTIHREINYPLAPPTVTCLSQQYFLIYPAISLLAVPLAESDFLLHLPDLYHELAHPLISTRDNPKLESFQTQFAAFQNRLLDHFQTQRATNIRSTGPKDYIGYVIGILERNWIEFWAAELFCDLFAAYSLGPAYGWTHFHLTATRKADPCEIRTDRLMSHPPDQARMDTILIAYNLTGFHTEKTEIGQRWNELIDTLGVKPPSLYQRACPQYILEMAATHALEGVKKMGCKIARNDTRDEINNLLNAAWKQFWHAPSQYLEWEKNQLRQTKRNLVPNET